MVSSNDCIKKFGDPTINQTAWEMKNMAMFDIDDRVNKANPVIPNRVYCNKVFGPVLNYWLIALMDAGLLSEIKTWDGCFNVRKKRGLSSLSMHAFGVAVDINAAHNPLGVNAMLARSRGLVPFTNKFIEASRKHVDCGADWVTRPDGMHFQIKAL